jgi:hypothetical protein
MAESTFGDPSEFNTNSNNLPSSFLPSKGSSKNMAQNNQVRISSV